jgi:hypothetical protein
MIRRALIAGAIMLGASSYSGAQVTNGETYGAVQFGSWTGVLVQHATDTRYRSIAYQGNWAITFDAMPPDCLVILSIGLTLGATPITADFPLIDVPGTMRIDQGQVFPTDFKTRGVMGDTSMIFAAQKIPNIDEFVAEMSNGQILRTKLTYQGQDYYQAFALNGFVSAFQGEMATCRSVTASQKAPRKPARTPTDKSL